MPRARGTLPLIVLVASLGGAHGAPERPVTFNRDVAPIVFERCTPCHRPGESAPFSFLTYDDVRKFGRQILTVTGTGFMPPWLPEAGYGDFKDSRRLSERELETLRMWVEDGTPEGDPGDLPPMPEWPTGWQLGEPDRIARLPEPFIVPADGPDVFRNFVIPVEVSETRYVQAVEVRPGNPRVSHHAIMRIDCTRSSRLLDQREELAGFSGMEMGESVAPDGHTIAWAPGKVPNAGDETTAWRLEPGTDLVLQLHMQPRGKPETVQPVIGLYFADEPPSRQAFEIMLKNRDIDIPPGEANYVVEDHYVLPVAVEVRGILPHAHYLGKTLEAYATLPDGSRRWLVKIPDWDFNWQDQYRYETPVELPAGSTIRMRIVYDNSTANVRNPFHPPRRVRDGPESTDEMGTVTLEVLPRNDDELQALREGLVRQDLEKDDEDWIAHYNLGWALQSRGELDEAIAHYRRVTQLNPGNTDARVNLAMAMRSRGEIDAAVEQLNAALRVNPYSAPAHAGMGVTLADRGQLERAIDHYRRALAVDPHNRTAQHGMGNALLQRGDAEQAIRHLEQALQIDDGDADAHNNLGNALARLDRLERAEQHFRRSIELDPDLADAHANLGNVLAGMGDLEGAVEHLRRANELRPGSADILHNLQAALELQAELGDAYALARRAIEVMQRAEGQAQAGRLQEALVTGQKALELATRAQAAELVDSIGRRLDDYRRAQR